MKVILDTDVIVAAMRSPSGASRRILELVEKKRLTPVLSVPLMFEYEAVLKREVHLRATKLTFSDIDRFLDDFAKRSVLVKIDISWRPVLHDADDEMVLEAAVNGGCRFIITFNIRDYAGAGRFNDIGIRTPSRFIMENDYA